MIAHKTNISTPTVSISKHIQKLLTNRGGSRGNIGGASPKILRFFGLFGFFLFCYISKNIKVKHN